MWIYIVVEFEKGSGFDYLNLKLKKRCVAHGTDNGWVWDWNQLEIAHCLLVNFVFEDKWTARLESNLNANGQTTVWSDRFNTCVKTTWTTLIRSLGPISRLSSTNTNCWRICWSRSEPLDGHNLIFQLFFSLGETLFLTRVLSKQEKAASY